MWWWVPAVALGGRIWQPTVLDVDACDPEQAARAHLAAMGFANASKVRVMPDSVCCTPYVAEAWQAGAGMAPVVSLALSYDCGVIGAHVTPVAKPDPNPAPSAALAVIRAAPALGPWLHDQDLLVGLLDGGGYVVWLVRIYDFQHQQTVARVRLGPNLEVREVQEDRGWWQAPEGPAVARLASTLQ